MKSFFATDFFGMVGIAAWLGFSGFFAVTGNGDFFQRMGAFGVAVAILYFAFVRHASPTPVQLIRDQQWNRKMFNLHRRDIHLSLQNTSVLAASIENKWKNEGKEIPQAIASLAVPILDGDVPKNHEIDWVSTETKSREVAEQMTSASNQVEKQKRFSQMFEIWVVVFATIQWGFGDLLFFASCEASC